MAPNGTSRDLDVLADTGSPFALLPLLRMTEYGGDRDEFWIREQP